VKTVQKTGGILTLDDFKNYTVKVEEALTGTYRGNVVYTARAPSSAPGKSNLHIIPHDIQGLHVRFVPGRYYTYVKPRQRLRQFS
jgi:hypothetical protein